MMDRDRAAGRYFLAGKGNTQGGTRVSIPARACAHPFGLLYLLLKATPTTGTIFLALLYTSPTTMRNLSVAFNYTLYIYIYINPGSVTSRTIPRSVTWCILFTTNFFIDHHFPNDAYAYDCSR